MTIIPAMTAFVVAMAGMMLPAADFTYNEISDQLDDVQELGAPENDWKLECGICGREGWLLR